MKKDLEDCFLPSKRNDYTPHILQKAAMIGMVALVILSFTIANVHSLIWISSQWMISTILPAVIVDLTNGERQEQALGTLRRSSVLDYAAQMKAQHMANNQYFAHYSPDGVSPWYWFGEASYNYVHAGENLAIHFTDSGDVVQAWMDSPTHRANIMNGNYAEIGVGTAEGTYDGYATVYVVQLFGTPAAIAQVTEPPAAAPLAVAASPASEQDEAVLAESVTITEEVVIHEAEPEPVPVQEEAKTGSEAEEAEIPESQPIEVAQTQQATTSSSTSETVIASMEETPYGIALYSDFISTSTGGIPATIEPDQPEVSNHAPFYMELATQPHKVLQILYIIIGLFVLVSLLISIILEARHQRPVQIAYGGGLIAVMGLLYFVHMIISNGALIV